MNKSIFNDLSKSAPGITTVKETFESKGPFPRNSRSTSREGYIPYARFLSI